MTDDAPEFPPRTIGKCIYCGSTARLTDEHIIPEGLRGTKILRSAACVTCHGITRDLEDFVLRSFDAERARLNVRGKTPRGKQTGHGKLVDSSGKRKTIRVDMRKFPVGGLLPIFAPPSLIKSPNIGYLEQVAVISSKALSEAFAASAGNTIQLPYSRRRFARFVAKISHCLAVEARGLEAFEPWLPKVIRGVSDDVFAYVGCDEQSLLPPTARVATTISWAVQERHYQPENDKLLEVTIRLFPHRKSPEYRIITGRARPAGRK